MVFIFIRFLEDFLLVKKGEEKKLFFFLLFFSLLMFAQELGIGVSASIFLTRAGIAKLPLMLLLAAVINFIAVVSYVYLSADKSNKSLFQWIIGLSIAVIIPGRLFAHTFPIIVSYLLYAASEFIISSVGLHFSVYLSDYFDTRQSKRLFPLIFAGSRIGGITGGIVLSTASKWLGTFNILYIWAGSLILSYILLIYIDNIFPPQVFDYEKQSKEKSQFFKHLKSAWQFLKGSLLLKSLAAGLFLLGFLSLVMKYLYSDVFATAFPNLDRLTAFFGVYTIIANLLGFFIQVVITNRVIDDFGLGAGNLAYSICFISGFAGLTFAYGIGSAVWARFTDEQLESAIQDPVEGLLYNAVPDNERARAKALSSGLIKPISEISGSIFLQLVKVAWTPVHIAFVGLVGTFMYFFVTVLQNKGYVEGLMEMVKGRTLNLEELENLRWEKASGQDLETLYSMTGGDDPAIRESAATLLLHLDEDINFKRLKQNFFLWTADVQEEFLKNYFRRHSRIDEDFLVEALLKCEAAVKILIIEYFIESASERAAEPLKRYLEPDADLLVQNSAMRYYIITQQDEQGVSQQLMEKRLNSDKPEVIQANLSMIRDLFDEGFMPYVREQMYNPNRNVSIDAINTLAIIYQPFGKEPHEVDALVKELIDRGGYHETKAAAMILGKRRGEKERNYLISLLDTSSTPLRDYLIEILSTNYPGDVEVFLERIESPNSPPMMKENLILLLQKIKKIPQQGRLKEVLRDLIRNYFELILEQDWLKRNNLDHSLMQEINERKKTQIRIMILELLEIFLHQRVVVSIEKALLTKNPRLISNAMELFENIWDKTQAKSLITLLYPQDFEEELKIGKKFFENGEKSTGEIFEKYLRPDLPRWDICACLDLLKEMPEHREKFDLTEFEKHDDPVVAQIAKNLEKTARGERGDFMLTIIEKVLVLKNAPIFKSLRMDELRMVAEIARERTYSPGEQIIEMGEVGSTMFIIASGEVEVFLPGSPRRSLAKLKGPEFFGEMALFSDDLRSASIMALKSTRLLCLDRDHFFNLIYEKPEISIEIIKVLTDRIKIMDKIAHGAK